MITSRLATQLFFMKYVTISILQVFVFKIFRFGDLHLMNPTNFSILPSINWKKQ